jgi:hypothetical protein
MNPRRSTEPEDEWPTDRGVLLRMLLTWSTKRKDGKAGVCWGVDMLLDWFLSYEPTAQSRRNSNDFAILRRYFGPPCWADRSLLGETWINPWTAIRTT